MKTAAALLSLATALIVLDQITLLLSFVHTCCMLLPVQVVSLRNLKRKKQRGCVEEIKMLFCKRDRKEVEDAAR